MCYCCCKSFNVHNDLSNTVCVPNKTEDLTLSLFNMITGINELRTLTKHISCECKCKFDGRKCNSNQWRNKDKCQCECKKHHIREKDDIWNPTTCSCENAKYLASVIDDSVIMCNGIIDEETCAILTNFNEKKVSCKTFSVFLYFYFYTSKIFIFYLHFY